MPKIARPWGLIITILVIDVALAATGAVLLAKGLTAKPEAAPPKTSEQAPPPPAEIAVAAAPASDVRLPASGSGTPETEIRNPPAEIRKPAETEKPETEIRKRAADAKPPTGSRRPEAGGRSAPTLDNEIELAATRSQAVFSKCAEAAQPHGTIRVAFQVVPDGQTSHVSVIEDSTGQSSVSSCLVATIQRWSFAVHPSVTRDFVRSFTYP